MEETVTNERMHERMDRWTTQSNMLFQLLQGWGHKNQNISFFNAFRYIYLFNLLIRDSFLFFLDYKTYKESHQSKIYEVPMLESIFSQQKCYRSIVTVDKWA